MAKRVTAPAQPVPQTREEFERLAVELGELIRETDRIGSEAADAISRINLDAKLRSGANAAKAKALWRAVGAYAEAHRAELLPKDRKSLGIAAGLIGWRIGKPKIDVDAEDLDDVVEALEAADLEEFLRFKTELDKAAILAAPGKLPPEIAEIFVPGREELFFKPIDSETELTLKAPAAPKAA